MFKFNWKPDWAMLLMRVYIGAIFIPHGYQKLFTYGLDGVSQNFEGMGIPLPYLSALLATFAELFGGIALILGIGTRITALSLAFTMLVAIITAHSQAFFNQSGGMEYPLTLGIACVAIFLSGGGAYSLDQKLCKSCAKTDQQLAEQVA